MGGLLTLVGSFLVLVGEIWIVVIAFQDGDTEWGILSLLCLILAIIYGVQNFDKAKVPVILMAVGFVAGTVGQFAGS